MSGEYEIRIRLTAHFENKPYFWSIIHWLDDKRWEYAAYGWAATSEQAFSDGMEYYNKMKG